MPSPYPVGDLQYETIHGNQQPYFLMSDGSKHYLSPRSMDPNAPIPTGGFLRGPGRWNPQTQHYDQPINWGNLLSAGVGGLLGAGALSAAGAFGGGAAGAGASLTPEGIQAGGLSAAVPGAGMASGVGLGGAAGNLGASIAGDTVGGAATGVGSRLLNKGLNTAIGLGAAGLGRALGGGSPHIPPELQQMLDLQKRRMQFQNPLFEAISRLAMSRLPIAQQQTMPSVSSDPMAALQRLSHQGLGG